MATVAYKKLQWVTRSYRGLRRVTRCYRWLQGVTEAYNGLQGVTRGYRGLQGLTSANRSMRKKNKYELSLENSTTILTRNPTRDPYLAIWYFFRNIFVVL